MSNRTTDMKVKDLLKYLRLRNNVYYARLGNNEKSRSNPEHAEFFAHADMWTEKYVYDEKARHAWLYEEDSPLHEEEEELLEKIIILLAYIGDTGRGFTDWERLVELELDELHEYGTYVFFRTIRKEPALIEEFDAKHVAWYAKKKR